MTDPPAPNVELLHRTMEQILARPELHFQGSWAVQRDCGTAMCFAGWACVLEGLELDANDLAQDGITSHLADGQLIEWKARDLLSIDWATAQQLFWPDNTTADLKHLVDEICEHGTIRDPWATAQVTE